MKQPVYHYKKDLHDRIILLLNRIYMCCSMPFNRLNKSTAIPTLLLFLILLFFICSSGLSQGDQTTEELTEEYLRAEQMLSSILISAPTGIGVVENRVIVSVNDYILELTGYSREELLGKNARMFYPDDKDFEYVGNEKYRQIAEKGTGSVETRWMHKDGSIINVILSSTPLDPEDLDHDVVFTVLDITDRKLAAAELENRTFWFIAIMGLFLLLQLVLILFLLRIIGQRKKAEAALRDSEEKHRRLFETMSQGVIYQDAKGNIISANPAAERILGITFTEMQGKNSNDPNWQMIDEDGRAVPGNLHPSMITLQTGKNVGPVTRGVFQPERNRHIWLSICAIPLFQLGENEPFQTYATFEDVTERLEAINELRRLQWMLKPDKFIESDGTSKFNEQSYGDLTVLNGGGLIINSVDKDILLDTANDYLDLMETSTAIYEANGDYALGIFTSGWCKALDEASRSLCETADNRTALNSGKWLCHESCWHDASKIAIERGETVDIECNGGLRLYTVPIWADNQVVGSINFGYGDPPRDKETLKIIADKYKVDPDELFLLAAVYETRPPFIIELAKKRLHSSARLIGTFVERKKRETEIMKFNEELEERVRQRTAQLETVNRELEAFSYSASHDLRGPLNRISGFSEALLEDYPDQLDPLGIEYLKKINISCEHMKLLIDDLLKLSKAASVQISSEPVDLSALVDTHLKELQEKEPHRVVEKSITPGLVVKGDTALLRIALENIIDNAWKFSVGKDDARIEFGIIEQNSQRVYYIRDNGVGFDMKYADELFNAFQRFHDAKKYPGTGIGLSIVSRIISRHGGKLWAEGELNKGACFYLTLPNSN